MKELLTLNPENATGEEIRGWRVREAARGVVVDEGGNLALLHVSSEKYYKLPGGGIDAGEDRAAAFDRECEEEIGSEIEMVAELGVIVEYRKIFELKQISYCYLAKLVGEKGKPNFTDKEKSQGFEVLWVPYSEAVHLLEEGRQNAKTVEGRDYIAPRDIEILKVAQSDL